MRPFVNKYARFRAREDGSATVEFVFLFPLFILIFLMGFESGYYMIRNVLLERAVDISVRDIRLGNGRVPSYDIVRDQICENTIIIPDCRNTIHIYMEEVPIAPGSIAAVAGPARCINRYSEDDQFDGTDYNVGGVNTMMIVQVCAVVSPLFPGIGVGLGLQRAELGVDIEGYEDAGQAAIVATTAFVTEPGTRAMLPDPSQPMGGGSDGGGGAGGSGDTGDTDA